MASLIVIVVGVGAVVLLSWAASLLETPPGANREDRVAHEGGA